MTNRSAITAFLAVAALGFGAPLVAQDRSAINPTELKAAVGNRQTARAGAVRELLSSDQARKLAEGMGVSSGDLANRVSELDAATLDRLGEQAGVTDAMVMRRRANVVISTTAIIIILLILILLAD